MSNKLWEDLILGVIGEQFTYPEEINGIVISIRNNQDTISIWNKSGRDQDVIDTIKKDIIRILGIPGGAQMNYDKFQNDEEKDRSGSAAGAGAKKQKASAK